MKSRTRPAAAETDFSVKTNSISTSVASGPEATGRSVSNGVRESEGESERQSGPECLTPPLHSPSHFPFPFSLSSA